MRGVMIMTKFLKNAIALFAVFAVLLCCFPMSALAAEGSGLQFRNGKFKILILSDLQDTNEPQQETTDMITAAITKTEPDLIVLLGDNIAGWWNGVDKTQTDEAIDKVAQPIEASGIPFALVFGNHDHEGLASEDNGYEEEAAKKYILHRFQLYGGCLATEGDEMTGVGNYNLTVKDSAGEKDIFNLWFMDSNPYATEEEGGGYGYVHEDQTQWYRKVSNELKDENGGAPMPSLLFQHIIVPEVYEMLTETEKGTDGAVSGNGGHEGKYYIANDEYIYQGDVNEGPCPPNTNHGQFESWAEQGDILGAFFGHDHTNTFVGEYQGIKLVACPETGFYSYGDVHGVRTVTLDENDLADFETEVIMYNDLLDYDVSNSYKVSYGYSAYKNTFLPTVFGTVGGIAAVCIVIAVVIVVAKKKKGKPEKKK